MGKFMKMKVARIVLKFVFIPILIFFGGSLLGLSIAVIDLENDLVGPACGFGAGILLVIWDMVMGRGFCKIEKKIGDIITAQATSPR